MNNTNKKIRTSSNSIIISVSLVLYVLGILGFIIIKSYTVSNYLKENLGFTIVLKDDIKEIELLQFQKKLASEKWIKSIEFINKSEAAKILKNEIGEDFISFLGYNPLSASIDVSIMAQNANVDDMNYFKSILKKNEFVKDVIFEEDLVSSINKNLEIVGLLFLGFGILLFVISIALINNTIRLSVYSKRFLIKTMKLVGAENKYIRKPFLANSVQHGVLSSFFSFILFLISLIIIDHKIPELLLNKDLELVFVIFIFMFAFGVAISALTTRFALTKYININEKDLYK